MSLKILTTIILVAVVGLLVAYPGVRAVICPEMLSWSPACISPNLKESVVSDEDIKTILDLHNSLRRKVAKGLESQGKGGPQPPAANMQELKWDVNLARAAQTLAQQCVFNHEITCNREDSFDQIGQNMGRSMSGKMSWNTTISYGWYGEVKWYDYKNNKCSGICGHYTQVVWARTSRVGCGKSVQADGTILHVCNYGRAGNWPVQPYTSGEPGSACPDGTKNKDGLCVEYF